MVSLKLSYFIGSLVTAVVTFLGAVLTVWVDTTARLEKAESAIQHTQEMTTDRLDRIEDGVNRINATIFTFNPNPNQNQNQSKPINK